MGGSATTLFFLAKNRGGGIVKVIFHLKLNTMAEEYLQLQKIFRKDFQSKALKDISEIVNIKWAAWIEVIKEQQNPHAKHLIRIIEATLRSKSDEPLYLDFDTERAEFAALYEKEAIYTKSQIEIADNALVLLERFFKSESHKEKGKLPFDMFVCEQLKKIVCTYRETITKPKDFHSKKIEWLKVFNEMMPITIKPKIKSVTA